MQLQFINGSIQSIVEYLPKLQLKGRENRARQKLGLDLVGRHDRANYLIAAVMVVSGVTVVYVLRMTADRMGDAQSILDGRQPTAWTQVVAVDDEGDAPRPWSLELTDQPGTYLHVGGTQKTQWRFERGETYLVHGFGPADNPYAGIVFFVRPHQRERSWHHAAPSTKRRYLSRTD